MSLNTNRSSTLGLFLYFRCSKLSYFMCNRFIQLYKRFTTRGCYRHLFKLQTMLSVNQLLLSQADWTVKALILVQKEVKKKLKALVKGYIQHEQTLVIRGSSVLGGQQEERLQRQLQINQLKIKAERNKVVEMFKR